MIDAGTPLEAVSDTVIAVTPVARMGTLPAGVTVRVPGEGNGFTVPCVKIADVEAPTFSRQKSKLTVPGSIICGHDKFVIVLFETLYTDAP